MAYGLPEGGVSVTPRTRGAVGRISGSSGAFRLGKVSIFSSVMTARCRSPIWIRPDRILQAVPPAFPVRFPRLSGISPKGIRIRQGRERCSIPQVPGLAVSVYFLGIMVKYRLDNVRSIV